MYAFEFEFWAILFLLVYFEILDSVTTWYCTRISGIPFEAGEENPIMRRLGPRKSALFGLLAMITVEALLVLVVYVLIPVLFLHIDPSQIFHVFPYPEVIVAVLFVALLEKFRAPYHNLRFIRNSIRQTRERT